MCNYWANRLCCEAADPRHADPWRHGLFAPQAVRTHLPPSPPLRITEGSEEIQKRKVAGFLFGYMGSGKR
jgi:butyryl-CoA dehydrogenase